MRWVFVVGFFRPRRLARALGTANVMKGGLQQPAGQRVINVINLIAIVFLSIFIVMPVIRRVRFYYNVSFK